MRQCKGSNKMDWPLNSARRSVVLPRQKRKKHMRKHRWSCTLARTAANRIVPAWRIVLTPLWKARRTCAVLGVSGPQPGPRLETSAALCMGRTLQSTSATSAAIWQSGNVAIITFVNPATLGGSHKPVQDVADARLAFNILLTRRVIHHLSLASFLAAQLAVVAQRRM